MDSLWTALEISHICAIQPIDSAGICNFCNLIGGSMSFATIPLKNSTVLCIGGITEA